MGRQRPSQAGRIDPSGSPLLPSDQVLWDGDASTPHAAAPLTTSRSAPEPEYTPEDPGYNGVTFYDRGLDDDVAFCHNATGGSGGLGDGDASMTQNRFWSGGPSQPCGPATPQSWGMRYATQIAWNASYTGPPTSAGVGHG